MSKTYSIIDLSSKSDDRENGAFDLEALKAEGVNSIQLINYLVQSIGPIASNLGAFLNNGCGFGVIQKGDEVTIAGLKPSVHGEAKLP